jgi:hypothetical protein
MLGGVVQLGKERDWCSQQQGRPPGKRAIS